MKIVTPLRSALLLFIVFLAGCAQPSREDPITARDDPGFDTWISKHKDVLSVADIKDLNDARQAFKFKVMQAKPGLASADANAALYAEIDGKTVNDVLRASYTLQIERLNTELANYQPLLDRQKEYQANPRISAEQRLKVDDDYRKIERLMGQRRDDIARLTEKLNALK